MIEFRRITTLDKDYYSSMENLMTEAFPKEEYRDLNELRDYTDNIAHFYNNILLEGGNTIGFLTYWDFEKFYYIEHFAIDPSLRNGGYGKNAIEALSKLLKKPIVLEVEHPLESLAERRINFYRRQGFDLWVNDYQQPPYRKEDGYLPMYLMVNGDLSIDTDYQTIKDKIHKDVYGV